MKPYKVQDWGLMPPSGMGGEHLVSSCWQDRSCLCGLLKPRGLSQPGLCSRVRGLSLPCLDVS